MTQSDFGALIKTFRLKFHCDSSKTIPRLELILRDKFEERNLAPTIVECNILIDAYAKANQVESMDKLFTAMTKKWRLRPTTYTYNSLFYGYVKVGDNDKALQLYSSFKKAGFADSDYTHGVILRHLSSREGLEEVETHFRSMASTYHTVLQDTGHTRPQSLFSDSSPVETPSVHVIDSIIASSGRFQQPARAIFYFELLQKLALKPTKNSFGRLIHALCRSDKKETAWDFLMLACSPPHSFPPQIDWFHHFMKSYSDSSKPFEICKILVFYKWALKTFPELPSLRTSETIFYLRRGKNALHNLRECNVQIPNEQDLFLPLGRECKGNASVDGNTYL
jgi:pentatricopeptide repeat protein